MTYTGPKHSRLFAVLVCLVLFTGAFKGNLLAQTETKTPEMIEFDRLASLNAVFVTPKSFAQSQRAQSQWLRAIQQGKPKDEIGKSLEHFQSTLTLMSDRLSKATAILALPLSVRQAAVKAGAPTLAVKEFGLADAKLSEAFNKLDEDKTLEGDRFGKDSIPLYEVARIAAVRAALLGTVQGNLSEGKAKKADQLATVSYTRAIDLFGQVNDRLAKGEALSDDLSALAYRAESEARHALVLTARIDTLQKQSNALEHLLLEAERLVNPVAELAGVRVDYSRNNPMAVVETAVAILASQKDSLTARLSHHTTLVERMQTTIDSLKDAFAQQQIRIASMVDDYQRDLQSRKEELEQRRREIDQDLRKKMYLDLASQAQTRLTPKEALVLRDQKSITIRMVGLNFEAGETNISEKNHPTMENLGVLLSLYPKANIVIQGHTDTSGSESKNIELSELRAAGVRDNLLKLTGLPSEQLTSRGLGGSQPIADNTTPKGRDQNRRIDIVVTF